MPRIRLDALLVERALASSRERARALILAGQVKVNGAVAQKAGQSVPADATVALAQPDHPYVGRGGVKLAHALETFRIAGDGREALDIGASTGGFTDVLLRNGVRRVVALDVGRGQIAWALRTDPRVVVLEGVNARALTRPQLPAAVELVVIDVSFISLRHILPALPPLLTPAADIVALVKPQFEAARREVGKGGVIKDAAVQQRVVEEIIAAASEVGLSHLATTESPITGSSGNREFFIHLRAP
jgi:23S rRNA (cytidine1920-2'-O)/16S rRNA (cytidine1409-2'-O)-methyltransferase